MIIITATNCWFKVSHLKVGWKDQNGKTKKQMTKDLRKLELSENETKNGIGWWGSCNGKGSDDEDDDKIVDLFNHLAAMACGMAELIK